MDQHTSTQPLPLAFTTDNPVAALGQKVKAAFVSHQRPSVRILGGDSSKSVVDLPPRDVPPTETKQHAVPPGIGAKFRSLFSGEGNASGRESFDHEYDRETVDLLDVVDPEVSTLSTLTNVQNSLFIPSVGPVFNRRPAYKVSDHYDEPGTVEKLKSSLKRISYLREEDDEKRYGSRFGGLFRPRMPGRTNTIPSTLTDSRYAVMPEGETLTGWTHMEKEELDDMVRHMLHSRKARAKRAMKGFSQYVCRPMGMFVTVYATLITLFGAAWVLFLIGWISVGSKKDYIVNIVDNVLVALFAIIGDGLAPFRAVDTYHMAYIVHYHHKTHQRRAKSGLPDLVDSNDLPDQRLEDVNTAEVDIESGVLRKFSRGFAKMMPKRLATIMTQGPTNDPSYEYSVLTEEEQTKLEYHERKFSKSHTFYKPHETETHYAFPVKLLIAVVLLLDLHSCLQISLGACTWGINYKTRPFALTTVILCCSITCNIMGGVLISLGDKRTRKRDVIERMMRQELTSEAIQKIDTRRLKEAEERGEIDESFRKNLKEQREEAENEEIKKAWKVVPKLPKTLLGKGEDHRQPALPQKARRSSADVSTMASGSSAPRKDKSRSSASLPVVQEDSTKPSLPKTMLKRGEEPLKESAAQKALRLIRRADFDKS